MAFICQPESSEDTLEVSIQAISKAELMGELAVLLALPFSLVAWRRLNMLTTSPTRLCETLLKTGVRLYETRQYHSWFGRSETAYVKTSVQIC
jgi:hypothetical protein